MKRCPICKTIYPDDANFCPMDASGLDDVPGGATPSLDLPTMQARLIAGRFKLGPQVGGRRTGEVFSAEDITTGLPCAVKIIAPAVFPTPLVAQRTERELKQLMKVVSERIAKVLDVGRTGDRLYVATELVSGVTLEEVVITNGPLAPDQAARLGVEVGEALAEAAKLGVIHRDVAPKNVIILADQRSGRRVKIINFGIPTPASDKVLGVPEFLSPEQAEGKPVDQRSNIYSLGALLYFMLTGEAPFHGPTDEVLRKHASATPTPVGEKSPRQGVPQDLERLVMKALEKASSRRHLTLRQLLGELEAIASHMPPSQPIAAPAPKTQARAPSNRPSAAQAAQRPPTGQPAPRVSGSVPAQKAPPVAEQRTVQITPGAPAQPRHGSSATSKTIVGLPLPAELRAPRPSAQQPAPAPPVLPVTQQIQVDNEPATVPIEKVPAFDEPMAAAPGAMAAAPALVQPPAALPPPKLHPHPYLADVPSTEPAGPVVVFTQPSSAGSPRSERAGGKKGARSEAGQGQGGGAQPSSRKGGKFRETMWFKKGELDEAAAEADAPGNGAPAGGDATTPIEERYKDDGTLTAADRERLSLRTGATQMMEKFPSAPASKSTGMGEDDIVRELKGISSQTIAMIAGGVVVALLVVIYFVFIR